MNILIVGGEQACGPGLPTGKSYVAQLIRRIRVARHSVQVDYRYMTLAESSKLLPRLHLADYDLILLQFDLPLNELPARPVSRILMRARLLLDTKRLTQMKILREQLAKALLQVRVYNRQVVLMSPLPHSRGLEQQVIQIAHSVYVQESRDWQVPLFDVSQRLAGGNELFQTGSTDRLSAVAHELLGSELHTFITEPTYTLWP